jgi:membrane protein DedA with SNARE-associated domain
MELLGDYHLNRALHALQLGALWSVHELTPHMGVLDGAMLGVSYARNFYDSDQRPLRGALTRLDAPTLLVHGRRDSLVPIEAAREHHRLVPQSELRELDSDHFFLLRRASGGPASAAAVGGAIAEFVDRVERGVAPSRAAADRERVRRAAEPMDSRPPPARGIAAIVLMALIAAATLVSEDLTCIGAGLLAAQGRLPFALAAFACFAGIVIGDLWLYWTGRLLGGAALSLPWRRWILSDEALAHARGWLAARGPAVILLSRFTPGTRLATYLCAGSLGMPVWAFTASVAAAAAVWTPVIVGVAMLLGRSAVESALVSGPWAILAFIAAIAIVVRFTSAALTRRGRRLLVSRWRRCTRWEFWPPWVFYLPVLGGIAWLMLKHRSATVFTAANPGIVAGGFIGESKIDILRGLGGAGSRVAPAALVPAALEAAGRIDAARRFMAEHGLDLPIVLKPNAGQRGSGVAVIRSEAALCDYLTRASADTIAQAYAGGLEFGVFYVRKPSEPTGRIFSVTEKRFTSVVADGRSTLESLILRDDRAVCMARVFLREHASRLEEVPSAGERIALVEVGTHCRGALFLDGARHRTPALDAAVDEVSRAFEGFYFGRFDVRTESIDAFREGRFTVVELNGVTSEATSIYDPANSLFSAYRTLFAQWRLAFEIGAENRARGVAPASVLTLLALLRDYRRASRAHAYPRVEPPPRPAPAPDTAR